MENPIPTQLEPEVSDFTEKLAKCEEIQKPKPNPFENFKVSSYPKHECRTEQKMYHHEELKVEEYQQPKSKQPNVYK